MAKRIASFFFFACCFSSFAARADIVETQMRVPVSIHLRDGSPLTQEIVVTRFQDSERKPSRFMLILHGRAGTPSERKAQGRVRYADIARDFAAQGYAVFVPTRIGYGETGGPDAEETGRCDAKDYINGMAPAVDAMMQLISVIRAEPGIGNSSGVIIGQSVGGLLTTALASRNVPRVVAYVNFAGGSGGNPKEKPGQPCGPDRLRDAYAAFGAKARTPVLWLYSANDRYWGEALPREWFAAYKKSGGRGRFIALPPNGDDGHSSFTRNRPAWGETVTQFLQSPQ